MKIQSKKFPLYPGMLILIESKNTPKLRKLIPDMSEDDDLFCQTFQGEYKGYRSFGIVINSKRNYPDKCEPITHGIVAHEALHVVHSILSTIGFELDDNSQEAYAYLIEWVVDEIYLWANKIDLKIV